MLRKLGRIFNATGESILSYIFKMIGVIFVAVFLSNGCASDGEDIVDMHFYYKAYGDENRKNNLNPQGIPIETISNQLVGKTVKRFCFWKCEQPKNHLVLELDDGQFLSIFNAEENQLFFLIYDNSKKGKLLDWFNGEYFNNDRTKYIMDLNFVGTSAELSTEWELFAVDNFSLAREMILMGNIVRFGYENPIAHGDYGHLDEDVVIEFESGDVIRISAFGVPFQMLSEMDEILPEVFEKHTGIEITKSHT